MQLDRLPFGAPTLEDAIDSNPLVVAPETPLMEAMALMIQTRGSSCSIANPNNPSEIPIHEARSSCVLVMQGDELLGIFTERDIVRLTAAGLDFAEVRMAEVMAQPVVTLNETDFQDIFAALFLFRRYRIRHLVIVTEQKKVVGMVSSESLRQVLRPANVLKLRRVSEVMSTPVIKAHLNTSVQSLAQLMAKHRVSCVVIVEELATSYDLPMGIVTERDIVQFQSLQLNFSQTFAEMVMSTPLFLLSPEDSLWTAHQQMQKRRVRRLVVSWNWGMGLGIVTQTSLLRIFDPVEMYGVVQTLQQTVKQLEEEKTNAEDTEGLNPEISSPLPTSLDREGNANIQPPLTPHGLRLPLSSLRTHLEQLRDRSDLSVQQQQAILTQALAQLADLEHSIDGSAENLEANMGGSDRLSV